ncbi:MAG TPA: hypothetical protein VGL42_02270 [Opitutaceae bacterium]|jgi:hypothetical protein
MTPKAFSSIIATFALALGVAHAGTNVTANSTVTLNGTFGTGGTELAPQDLVNGVFQPEMTEWQTNSVSWYGDQGPTNNVVLDLNGTYSITAFTVQADDNDQYELDYLAPGSSTWTLATLVPVINSFGLVTRDISLTTPITATQLKFFQNGQGDNDYAVSQIDASGSLVSAPEATSTLGLFALGFALLGAASYATRRQAA